LKFETNLKSFVLPGTETGYTTLWYIAIKYLHLDKRAQGSKPAALQPEFERITMVVSRKGILFQKYSQQAGAISWGSRLPLPNIPLSRDRVFIDYF